MIKDLNLQKNYLLAKRMVPVLIFIIIMLIPLVTSSSYIISSFVFIGIYSIVAVSLCLLMGYAGQISLGHAAFYGIGAYGSAILTTKYGINPWLGMFLSALITSGLACLIGIPTLKLKEHYLSLATLGFGIMIYMVFKQEVNWTGGPSGLTGIPYLKLGSVSLSSDFQYFYLVWIFAFATVLICRNIVNSRVGRALTAIHGSEVAAEAMGIDTAGFKLQIFVASAFFASLAGSLYAHYITMINPSPFGFQMSIEFVLMVVVGGIASIWGPLLGVTLVTFLTEFLREIIPKLVPGSGGEVEMVAFGLILTIIMIYMPEGLFRGLMDRLERIIMHWQPRAKNEADREEGSQHERIRA